MAEQKIMFQIVDEKIQELKHEIIKKLQSNVQKLNECLNATPKIKNDEKSDKLEKTYRHRESKLTELYSKNEHYKSLVNFVLTLVFICLLHYIIVDCILTDEGKKDWEYFSSCVVGFDEVFMNRWLPMLSANLFIIYYGFRLWAVCRRSVTSLYILGIVDFVFLTGYVFYAALFLILPLKNVSTLNFMPKGFLIIEQVRMLMKCYAFVRSNVPKVIQSDQTKGRTQLPRLSQYVYFVFAPIMVYKDEYPRTSRVRWNVVGSFLFKLILTIFLGYYFVRRISLPFGLSLNLRQTKINLLYYLHIQFTLGLSAAFIYTLSFYGFFQCWLNMWAEMLRFGDRLFYVEFWTATSMGRFLRYWNLVVQDYIYTYLYRDFKILFKDNRSLTVLFSLIISQIFHDYLISCVNGSFFPMFLYLYGALFLTLDIYASEGVIFNGIVLTTVILGISNIMTVSFLDWRSTRTFNCTRTGNWIVAHLRPKFTFCVVDN